MVSDVVIKLVDVKKVYRTSSVVTWALKGVNLEVKKGDYIAIMGPSGSGKTTLLNIIGLLDKPTSGKVIIDGRDVSKLSSREISKLRNYKIGFVFQSFNLVNRLTVFENIELPLIPRGLPRPLRTKLVKEALLKAGGDLSWLLKKPNQLSGGQQQRVAIARAIVTNPAILLADEPTGNLDRKSAKQVIQTFTKLNQSGQTIIVVTHDPEVANCCKEILVIRDGKIIGSKSPDLNRCIINTVE
ncbi:MAG: ABC transporter ATP-binding protein [Thermoprotei archaeon]|nr:MAG: ABC transporter ATP-binding protein [Thermoprotei archaeon]